MQTALLVIHLLIALVLVTAILLQHSEGGALGMGGGMFTARGAASALTRTTAILATCFIVTSLGLALLAKGGERSTSALDQVPPPAATMAAPEPMVPAPAGAEPPGTR